MRQKVTRKCHHPASQSSNPVSHSQPNSYSQNPANILLKTSLSPLFKYNFFLTNHLVPYKQFSKVVMKVGPINNCAWLSTSACWFVALRNAFCLIVSWVFWFVGWMGYRTQQNKVHFVKYNFLKKKKFVYISWDNWSICLIRLI